MMIIRVNTKPRFQWRVSVERSTLPTTLPEPRGQPHLSHQCLKPAISAANNHPFHDAPASLRNHPPLPPTPRPPPPSPLVPLVRFPPQPIPLLLGEQTSFQKHARGIDLACVDRRFELGMCKHTGFGAGGGLPKSSGLTTTLSTLRFGRVWPCAR